MSSEWNETELVAIAAALRWYERRCDELMASLGQNRSLSAHERAEVESLYRSLKEDLKRAAKERSLSGDHRRMTRAESAFYDGAVRKAHIALSPKTNSHPILCGWFSAVYSARAEFSYYLRNMANLLPKAQ